MMRCGCIESGKGGVDHYCEDRVAQWEELFRAALIRKVKVRLTGELDETLLVKLSVQKLNDSVKNDQDCWQKRF